jgi:hypothetical protein
MLYTIMTAKLWFHIQQKDYLNTGCICYEDVLPHIVSGNYKVALVSFPYQKFVHPACYYYWYNINKYEVGVFFNSIYSH